MASTVLPVAPGEPAAVKACCGDLWEHPAVQMLAGPAFRPGGVAMTVELVARLDLTPGSLVLDIGSGTGASMTWLTEAGHRPVGVDYSASLALDASASGPVCRADAEALPFGDDAFDALLAECVMSVFPDKLTALGEARRVLRPDGHLVMSDVSVAGVLPAELDSLLGWVACAAGALPQDGWIGLLDAAGFAVRATEDRRTELADLVAQARRRLAMLQGAVAAGIVPPGLELTPLPGSEAMMPGVETMPIEDALALGQDVLGKVAEAVGSGTLGYVSLIAAPT